MPKLSTLATSILLTLGVSGTSLAYSGDFATSGAKPIPALLQFDEGRGPVTARQVTDQDHLQARTNPEQAVQNQVPTSEQPTGKDDFQQYFDRHFRAHLVLNASPPM